MKVIEFDSGLLISLSDLQPKPEPEDPIGIKSVPLSFEPWSGVKIGE